MPTNSNYDSYFTGIGDVPIFTYGMITITAGVLAYMTYMDPYIPDEAAEATEPILEATSMDGVVESNPMDTTGAAIPEEEVPPQEEQAEPIQEAEPIEEAQVVQEEPEPEPEPQEKPVAGGKRKKRTTRRRPISSGKKC
jgi:hypothetical protein